MKLDSYERASLDILENLRQNPEVLLLNHMIFRTIISFAKENKNYTLDVRNFDYVNMIEIVPSLFQEIQDALPFPDQKDLQSTHFVTELINSYGRAWVPVASHDYQSAISTSFIENIYMMEWQRYLRAKISKDRVELSILSVDPSRRVREKAIKTLKNTIT